jgi:hypothetical protein
MRHEIKCFVRRKIRVRVKIGFDGDRRTTDERAAEQQAQDET